MQSETQLFTSSSSTQQFIPFFPPNKHTNGAPESLQLTQSPYSQLHQLLCPSRPNPTCVEEVAISSGSNYSRPGGPTPLLLSPSPLDLKTNFSIVQTTPPAFRTLHRRGKKKKKKQADHPVCAPHPHPSLVLSSPPNKPQLC